MVLSPFCLLPRILAPRQRLVIAAEPEFVKRLCGPRDGFLQAVLLSLLAVFFIWMASETLGQSQGENSFSALANGPIYALAIQPDGKILVGGFFSSLGGKSRTGLGRFNSDGTMDVSFNPNANVRWPVITAVSSLAIQPDGKILESGRFEMLDGQGRTNMARLNGDGTLDGSFDSGSVVGGAAMALQADGKILASDGIKLIRLNPDGTSDSTFSPVVNASVTSILPQPDGKVLVAGEFTLLGGQSRTNLARLNPDGTPDAVFSPSLVGSVSCLALQPDGKIVVGGSFSSLGGQNRTNIARLNADGTVDTSFNAVASNQVFSVALQADGRIVMAAGALGWSTGRELVRLNADGTVDPTLDLWIPGQGYYHSPLPMALQAGGQIVFGANFQPGPGPTAGTIGRLGGSGTAAQSLAFDGSTLMWVRGGTAPEVWRTTFAYSTNGGSSWTELGSGQRISGGWAVTVRPAPTDATFVARGYVVGGWSWTSVWVDQSSIGPPSIDREPGSVTRIAGLNAGFSVSAVGSPPLHYQWRKDGRTLTDGGNVSGATSPSLILSDVNGSDAGQFSVTISSPSGLATSTAAGLTVVDPAITEEPISQTKHEGDSVTFSVTAAGSAPLTYQWRKEELALPGATNSFLTLTNVQGSDEGNYGVLITNSWGAVTSAVAILIVKTPTSGAFSASASGPIGAIVVQSDGKIVVGGGFSSLSGQSRSGLGRFNVDGTLDTSFTPGANSYVVDRWRLRPFVASLVVQPDGKILVGGTFDSLGGLIRTNLGRLNADTTTDPGFDPGPDDEVSCLSLQPDGKILVGGGFSKLAGQSRKFLGRLTSEGSLDPNFNPDANGSVTSITLQPDGKLLVVGDFSTLGGQNRTNLGRLNADGTLDSAFNPGSVGQVGCLVLQPDGKIVVGGSFRSLGGENHLNIGRLNADGSVDASFTAVATNEVLSLAVQTDGKLLVVEGAPYQNFWHTISRLNSDGTLDPSLDLRTSWSGSTPLSMQADGRILVGNSYLADPHGEGPLVGMIGRYDNAGPAIRSLAFDGSTLTWTRAGAGPEVWRTTFDYSPDGGASWVGVGEGVRIAGGWQLSGIDLPTSATFRARGYTVAGSLGSSAWYVESSVGAPAIIAEPVSLTNNAATGASFSVLALGSAPLRYQWRKDGLNLADLGGVSGATTPALTLSNVYGIDAGQFSVVITNVAGSVTSTVARLTVVDPVIVVQPVSQTNYEGDIVTFAVGAVGTSPLTLEWRKDGVALAFATGPTLTLTNVSEADAGRYDVVVTNALGSVLSVPALLSVDAESHDSLNPGADGMVSAIALQGGGKILVGGSFSTLGGRGRNCIGRLNANGTVDLGFNPGAGGNVASLVVQPDERIFVGGDFWTLGGQTNRYIGRLSNAGVAETFFNPGADAPVQSLALNLDTPGIPSSILVGGFFTALGGQSRYYLGRLWSESLGVDSRFNPVPGAPVNTIIIQPDGRILIASGFGVIRLNGNGTKDSSFKAIRDGRVDCLALQPDGKIIVGGFFTTLGGQSCTNLARLDVDGTLDSSFNSAADGDVNSVVLQTDGKVLVGGSFTALDGQSRNNLGLLNPDGSLEPNFNPGADGQVMALALQADGRIVVGGIFSTLNGKSQHNLGRLTNIEPGTQSLAFDGSTFVWMRGGASPEVQNTDLQFSPDGGGSWFGWGPGTRIPGGWQFSVQNLPINTSFRARGFTVGGSHNASAGLVEAVLSPKLTLLDVHSATDGQFSFTANGPAGLVVAIETTADLRTWTPVQTNTLDANSLIFKVPQPTARPGQFYRLRSPP